jgi:ubiquinone biosynthesis monooxygenase Coq7
MSLRHLSLFDHAITQFDRALRTLTPGTHQARRTNPAEETLHEALDSREQRHAAGLMRVNHSGEVCAQALYQGQALTAKLPHVRQEMEAAADEEIDHLAWCEERLKQLGSRPSLLNPLWYGLSYGLGATAGLINDKVSLGFVAATEDQVCDHLREHLVKLPEQDTASRAIVRQMFEDEARHGAAALKAGGYDFPLPIKSAMRLASKAMTGTSYHL